MSKVCWHWLVSFTTITYMSGNFKYCYDISVLNFCRSAIFIIMLLPTYLVSRVVLDSQLGKTCQGCTSHPVVLFWEGCVTAPPPTCLNTLSLSFFLSFPTFSREVLLS